MEQQFKTIIALVSGALVVLLCVFAFMAINNASVQSASENTASIALTPTTQPYPAEGITVPNRPKDSIVPAQIQAISLDVDGRRQVSISGDSDLSFNIGINPGRENSSSAALDLDITAQPFEHTHKVSGKFQFEYQVGLLIDPQSFPLFPWKAPVSNTSQSRLVREAVVVLEDECKHYIKRQISSDGDFSFEWTPVGCDKATITVWSVAPGNKADKVGVGKWLNGPVNTIDELTANTSDYFPYSFSYSFDIDLAQKNGGNGLNLGTITIPLEDEASRGFFIMDNALIARSYYDSLPGVSDSELVKLNIVHTKGLKPNAIACDAWDSNLKAAIYVPGKDPGFISIPWDCADLGRNAHAHIHETSHYFQRLFLRQNPDYGRFGEGLANAQAAIIRNSPWITTRGTNLLENLDVNSRRACWGGTKWDSIIDLLEEEEECKNSGGTPGFPQAVAWDNTLGNAGWFQRIVWDLVDGGADDPEPLTSFIIPNQSPNNCSSACEFGQFDKITGGSLTPASALAVNDVLIYYLGGERALGNNPNYIDRGLDGLDITDFLDGMICRGHITANSANELVATAMGLNYEAEGGPTSCPHPSE